MSLTLVFKKSCEILLYKSRTRQRAVHGEKGRHLSQQPNFQFFGLKLKLKKTETYTSIYVCNPAFIAWCFAHRVISA